MDVEMFEVVVTVAQDRSALTAATDKASATSERLAGELGVFDKDMEKQTGAYGDQIVHGITNSTFFKRLLDKFKAECTLWNLTSTIINNISGAFFDTILQPVVLRHSEMSDALNEYAARVGGVSKYLPPVAVPWFTSSPWGYTTTPGPVGAGRDWVTHTEVIVGSAEGPMLDYKDQVVGASDAMNANYDQLEVARAAVKDVATASKQSALSSLETTQNELRSIYHNEYFDRYLQNVTDTIANMKQLGVDQRVAYISSIMLKWTSDMPGLKV